MNFVFYLVKSVNGPDFFEYSSIKILLKFVLPKKLIIFFIFLGVGHSVISLILFSVILMPFFSTRNFRCSSSFL